MADDHAFRTLRPDAPLAGASGTARPTANDPLAELARLIGQDDLFEKMRRDAAQAAPAPEPVAAEPPPMPAPRRGASDLRASYDPLAELAASAPRRRRFEPAVEEAHAGFEPDSLRAYRRTPAADPYAPAPVAHADYAAAPAYAVVPSEHAADPHHAEPYEYAAAPPAGYPPAEYDSADYGYDDPAYAEEPPALAPRRRGGLMVVGAVLGLAVVGTAGAFAYRAISGGEGGQPPVIKANTAPAKVAAVPATRDTATRTTYDRSDKTQPERMQSREEQPMQLAEVRPATPRHGPLPAAGSSITAFAPSADPAPAPAPQANANEPKRVRTIAIRPDGSVAPEPAVRSANTGSIGRTAAVTPVVPRAGTRAAAPEANRAPAGSHVVQVASQKTEEDAQASFRALQAKYPTVLGGRQALIRKTDLGERGVFYRVQVGPFATAEAANEMCGNLKAAGGQCIVQRN